MPERKKKNSTASSVISGILFVLFVAGGPILRMLRNLFGGTVALPNISNVLPLIVGVLVALGVLVAIGRAIGRATQQRGDTRLPTNMQAPSSGVAPQLPAARAMTMRPPSAANSLPRAVEQSVSLPSAPRFDPIFPPALLLVGIVGMLVLAGVALVVLG